MAGQARHEANWNCNLLKKKMLLYNPVQSKLCFGLF
jgi:hypothetical protein